MKTAVNTHDPWPLQPDKCSADLDFIEWIGQLPKGVLTKADVFHMGPGSHHIVGRTFAQLQEIGHVTALTISPAEVETYLRAAEGDAELACQYQVLFGDLYRLSAAALPQVSISTLFHIGETWKAEPTPADMVQAIDMVASRTGSLMLFYRGSSAWDRVEPVLRACESEKTLRREGDFKSLRIYSKM